MEVIAIRMHAIHEFVPLSIEMMVAHHGWGKQRVFGSKLFLSAVLTTVEPLHSWRP